MGAFKNVPKGKLISVCAWGVAAVVSVVVFCFLQIRTDSKSAGAVVSNDKIDSTVLPEPRGENPFVGKIYSSPERTIRYIFQSESSMLLEHIFSMDSKFTMPFSIRCDYSVDAVGGKLFIKPVELFQEEGMVSRSSKLASILNDTLFVEVLERYPKFADEENFSEIKDLSLGRAKKLVDENLFEIFSFDYTLLPSALLVEELFPERCLIRRNGLRFISDDDSRIFKISPTDFYLVYNDGSESFSYGGVPDYESVSEKSDSENTEVKLTCAMKLFDSNLALGEAKISDVGNLEARIYIDESSRTVQSVDVYMEIISAPESFCLSAGERFKTRLRSAELLDWMRLEDDVPMKDETEEK